jgi:hypothetical protein
MARFGARAAVALALAILAAAAGGCAGAGAGRQNDGEEKQEKQAKIRAEDLTQLNRDLGDRYVAILADATEAVARDNPSLEQCALAKSARFVGAASVYEIVTSADPFTQIVDLLVTAELATLVWDEEGLAVRTFGVERGEYFALAMQEARREARQVGMRAMNGAQLAMIEQSVRNWRQENPDVDIVALVRFREFTLTPKGRSLLASVGGGLGWTLGTISPFSQVGRAGRSVESTRELGERALFLTQRLPLLVNWQVDAIVTGTLAKPEVDRAVGGFLEASGALARVAATLERITGPEGAAELGENLREARAALAEGKEAAAAVGGVVRASEALSADLRETMRVAGLPAEPRPEGAPPAKPFDVAEVGPAADRLAASLRDADALVREVRGLATSPELERRIAEVRGIAAEAQGGAAGLVELVFRRAVALLAILFALLFVYRGASRLLARGGEAPWRGQAAPRPREDLGGAAPSPA